MRSTRSLLFAVTGIAWAISAQCSPSSSIDLTKTDTLKENLSVTGARSYAVPAPNSSRDSSGTTGGGNATGSSAVAGTATSTSENPVNGNNGVTGAGSVDGSNGSASSPTIGGGGSASSGSNSSSNPNNGGFANSGSLEIMGPPYLPGSVDVGMPGGMGCLPGMADCGGSTGIIGIGGLPQIGDGFPQIGGGMPAGLDWNTLIQIGAPIIGAVTGNTQIGSLVGSAANLYQSGSLIPNGNWNAQQWANLGNVALQGASLSNRNNTDLQRASQIAAAGTTVLNGYTALNNNQPQMVQVGVSANGQPIYQAVQPQGAYAQAGQVVTGIASSDRVMRQPNSIVGNQGVMYQQGNVMPQYQGDGLPGLTAYDSGALPTTNHQINNPLFRDSNNSVASPAYPTEVPSLQYQTGAESPNITQADRDQLLLANSQLDSVLFNNNSSTSSGPSALDRAMGDNNTQSGTEWMY